MAWTTPRTWTVGELVTASIMNTHVKDNFNALNRAPCLAATVGAAQTTTSLSYTDLATAGPAVTMTTGTSVFIQLTAEINHNSVRHYMGVTVSGASTIAADDSNAMLVINADTYQDNKHSAGYYLAGLTAGSNVFTAKYKVGSGTGTFGLRQLAVWPTAVVS